MAKPFILTAAKRKKFEIVCARIAGGESLAKICETEKLPCKDAVLSWLRRAEGDDRAWLHDRYARARDNQADHYADEIITIADDDERDYMLDKDGNEMFIGENVQRSRLRVDARKWVAGKLKPKVYSDKLDLNVSGDFTVNIGSKDADCA